MPQKLSSFFGKTLTASASGINTTSNFISNQGSFGDTNELPSGTSLNVVPTSSTAIAGLFSGTTSSDMVRITQLGTGNALVVEDSANSDATPFVVTGTGSVGIGTTNPTSKLDLAGNTLSRSEIKNYTETTSALGNTGAAATIDLANGTVFTATLTDNCTWTFTTGVTTGTASFTLILTNDATAGRSLTWPVAVKWPNNTIPSRTTTANATDIWSFFTPNNGTNWYGNIALYNFT